MAMAQPKHLQLAYTPEYPIPAHPSHQLPRADQNLRNLQENIFRAPKEKILTRYTMVRAPFVYSRPYRYQVGSTGYRSFIVKNLGVASLGSHL